MEQPLDRRMSQANHHVLAPAMSRSNSSHSSAELRLRPKSRGSTASLQSVGVGNAFQPQPPPPPPPPQQQQHHHNISIDQHQVFLQQSQQQMQHVYPQQRHDDMMRFQDQLASMPSSQQQQQQMMDPSQAVFHNQAHDIRPMSQAGFHHDMQQFSVQYPSGMPQYPMPAPHLQHVRHQSEQYEGSPAPEDSSNENGGGAKRRKGAASSMANEQELNRLLEQNKAKTLKEIAEEVQKNEGGGGKAEKAKQVFAMLWLRENCVRSTHSVRRDRVFARYTERCANERVPTLNPASFGKLVRIIFPNVQTRRLGVRGESKYHYVDLSLVPDGEQQSSFERPGTSGSITARSHDSFSAGPGPALPHIRAASVSQTHPFGSMETADFPLPSTSYRPRSTGKRTTAQPAVEKIDCRYLNTPTIRIPTKGMANGLMSRLPAVRSGLPGTMAAYLAMPSENSLLQPANALNDTPIELPNIHDYLAGETYDHQCAKLLQDLYRSYCIDVIDAFRKCKEKSFFSHHSAFNGKMTVPVSKVFTMECIAPWIQECDMQMYKQIVKFLAHLAKQEVPANVWSLFSRVSLKLVGHLVAAFEEKCPPHTVAAKTIPAARFTTLLKKLHGANAAALKVNSLLNNPEYRTQMWLDLVVSTDPDMVLEDSNPPPESLDTVRGMLKHDLRFLLAPIDDEIEHLVTRAESDPTSAYGLLLTDEFDGAGVLPADIAAQCLLDPWIQWLEKLPAAFEGHHPQCMMDWHSRFWRSIMAQLGSSDDSARSYAFWWCFESFATSMLAYMTQMEGFLLPQEDQKLLDLKEKEKRSQEDQIRSLKRKRQVEDDAGHSSVGQLSILDADGAVATQMPLLPGQTGLQGTDGSEDVDAVQQTINTVDDPTSKLPAYSDLPSPAALPNQDNVHAESDAEMDELNRGGPLDLPIFRTGFSSPLKLASHPLGNSAAQNDDSGIGLGLDDHDDAEDLLPDRQNKKFNKRDWFMSSDPVESGNNGLGVAI